MKDPLADRLNNLQLTICGAPDCDDDSQQCKDCKALASAAETIERQNLSQVEDTLMPRAAIDVVCAVIKNDDVKYLLCQRPEDKDFAGLWEFPGGKVESGESHAYALHREIEEELGMGGAINSWPMAMFPNEPFNCYYYQFVSRDDPILFEHQDLGWFTLDEMNSVMLTPSGEPFASHLRHLKSTK